MTRKALSPLSLCLNSLKLILLSALLALAACSAKKEPADTIFFNGNIVTVDSVFTIARAVAVKGEHFLAVGSDEEILAHAGAQTRKVDLDGRTVIPGLIEAHAHPETAALSELEEPLPNPRTVGQLLEWIRQQATVKPKGEWIIHSKLFATRLKELRPPTLAELDASAPDHPVFLDGSFGGTINSAAMRASGITDKTEHPGLLRDAKTGKLNGKIQYTAFDLLKKPEERKLSNEEYAQALKKMFSLYNRVGFTSFTSGALLPDETEIYYYMKEHGMLTIRAFLNILAPFPFKEMSLDEIRREVAALGEPTGSGDEWVRTGALKTFMDGGILTGTAYLRQPWGPEAREIFGVVDPGYRGIPAATAEQFARLVQAGAEAGWKMTAHATGGGAVDLMLEAYEQVNRNLDIRPLRFSIIHGNFYDEQAIERCRTLGVIADSQPAWFYKDADAMYYILGKQRVLDFHPYLSLIRAGVTVSAGSDHMVILHDKESINPYSPWLAMWTMVTRQTERGSIIAPEEALTRKEALQCYTINNAYSTFEENIKGSIEVGKLADLVVLEYDLLTCPAQQLRDMKVIMTVLGGKLVYEMQ